MQLSVPFCFMAIGSPNSISPRGICSYSSPEDWNIGFWRESPQFGCLSLLASMPLDDLDFIVDVCKALKSTKYIIIVVLIAITYEKSSENSHPVAICSDYDGFSLL